MNRLLRWVVPDDLFAGWTNPWAEVRYRLAVMLETNRRMRWLIDEQVRLAERAVTIASTFPSDYTWQANKPLLFPSVWVDPTVWVNGPGLARPVLREDVEDAPEGFYEVGDPAVSAPFGSDGTSPRAGR